MRAQFLPLLAWLLVAPVANAAGVRVGSFVAENGVQRVAHGLGEAPAALLIWTEGLEQDSTGGPGAGLHSSISFCDAEGCLGLAGLATQLTTLVSSFGGSHGQAVQYLRFTANGNARLTGWDSEHFRLSWSSNPPAIRIHFLAVGGPHVRAKLVQWQLPPESGALEVSGIGFQPELLLTLFGGRQALAIPQINAWNFMSLSAATGPGAQSWVSGFTSEMPTLDSRWNWQESGVLALEGASDRPPVVMVELRHFTPDGFVAEVPVTTGERGMLVSLALAGVEAEVGTTVAPSTTGDSSLGIDALAFAPQALLLKSSLNQADSKEIDRQAAWGLGAADGTHQLWGAYRAERGLFDQMISVGGVDAIHAPVRTVSQVPTGRVRLERFTPRGFELSFHAHDGVPVEFKWLALSAHSEPRLVFRTQPTSVAVHQPLPMIEVSAHEFSPLPAQIELSVEDCGTGASLEGRATRPVVDGVARFDGLSVSAMGSGCRLVASPSPHRPARSVAFDVSEAIAPSGMGVGCGCGAAPAGLGFALLASLGLLRRRR